jgi:hypothetical protein
MEHASIAAFARFALQLLALAAPAELVEAATSAMADETRHAKLCFGLASRYSNAILKPGPLPMEGALDGTDLLSTVDLAVTEGCIGEVSAALEAAWTASATRDPAVRRVLESIADDEARHAALAFRFVAWAAEHDARVVPRVRKCLAEALRRERAPEASTLVANRERSPLLLEHGVPDASLRAAARRAALEDVAPGVVRLLETGSPSGRARPVATPGRQAWDSNA